jgi:uncharacterized protein YegP (UPF0339 family)
MDSQEIKFENGFRAIITKNKNGKYIYVLSRRNKNWESTSEYSRPYTARRGVERAINRLTLAK